MKEEVTQSEAYLKQLPVEKGFKVPDGYFEQLDWRLEENCSEDAGLEFGMAEDTWTVPEGYFGSMENRIMNRLPKAPKKTGSPVYLNLWVRYAGIAAAIVLVAGMFFSLPPSDTQTENTSGLKMEDVASHLSDVELDADLLCDAGWCNELDQMENNNLEKDVEEYLLDSGNTFLMDEI